MSAFSDHQSELLAAWETAFDRLTGKVPDLASDPKTAADLAIRLVGLSPYPIDPGLPVDPSAGSGDAPVG